MKTTAFLSILSALATAFLLTSSANANLALPHIEIHSQLAQEQVDIKITGDQGEVTGTFKYIKTVEDYYDLTLYLPVYAKEGTPVKDFTPDIHFGDQKLEVVFVKKEWEQERDIRDFGSLPQVEGQRVYWFMIPHVPQQPEQKEFTLKIRYTQKLAGGKFIYTPLIPKQLEGKDYGSITISADRPLTLIDADKHSFEKDGDKFVVDPSDKRGIIVEVAKVAPKFP